MSKMESILLRMPKSYLERIDELVRGKLYPNRDEAIQAAVKDLLMREAGGYENIPLCNRSKLGKNLTISKPLSRNTF